MPDNKYIRVQDHPGLARDRYTNAIVDVNHDDYERYITTKNAKRKQLQQIETMESRINNVEQNLSEIKSLLIKLLEDRHGTNI